MTRYILIPQRQGKSQRLTLPMEMLRTKDWLHVDCYVMKDSDGTGVTLTPYLWEDKPLDEKCIDPDCSGNNQSEAKHDD